MRRVATLVGGESAFVMPGTLGPPPASARCLSSLTPKRRSELLAAERQNTLSLIFLQTFSRDGTAGGGAFISERTDELKAGMNIGGVELPGPTALLVGLVPDGVQRVSVRYEPQVVFWAAVHDNVFYRQISNRRSIGTGDPPERETWRDRRGKVLRTIIAKSDGTIIIYRPGHTRQVIPSD